MAQIRAIRNRMTAVGTITRITKTMQMIATAKFTAALTRAKDTRPYTDAIQNLVGEVSGAAGDYDSPLFAAKSSAKKELLLVISSDRGLCGAYNGNVLRIALNKVREAKSNNKEIIVETAGKKAAAFFKFQKHDPTEKHSFGDTPKFEDIARLADTYMCGFAEGEWDSVSVAYTRFESNARQIPEVIQLLPLSQEEGETEGTSANYDFSPSAEAILDDLLPRSIKTTLFQAFNDAAVSEQIMRMIAMKAASENANDLGKDLKRDYNRARQAQITTELTEIISGAAALE
jgi:F-type H+-transporting ATPase subunit gamma